MYNLIVKAVSWILGALTALFMGYFGWMIVHNSRSTGRTETPENHQYLVNAWKPELDPKLGAPLPGIAPEAIRLPSGNPDDRALVIAIGSCESCTAKTFDASWLTGTPASRIVALYEGTPPKTEEPLKPPYTDRLYLSDSDFAKLNVLWPRLYALDSQGRLLAAQTVDESEEDFVHKWFK